METSVGRKFENISYGIQVSLNNSTTETEIVTEDTLMEEVETFLTYKIATFIAAYWFPIMVPTGLIGNTLSFLVMIKGNNRKMSTCNYMAALSINDNIMMVLALDAYLLTEVKVHIMNESECKFLAYLHLLFLQNSTFQVFAMTVDKFIAVKWPHKAAIYSTVKRVRITASGLFICGLIYNIPHLFTSRLFGDQCLGFMDDGIFTKVYSWLSFFVNGVVPFALLIYMNFIIVKTVKGSRKMFARNKSTATGAKYDTQHRNKDVTARERGMRSAENQLTKMLLLVTTFFLILLIPTYMRFIYLSFVKRDTPTKFASSMLFFHVSHKLYHTNNAVNFFLYCISGQKFRSDLKEILCCIGKSGFKLNEDELWSNTSTSNLS